MSAEIPISPEARALFHAINDLPVSGDYETVLALKRQKLALIQSALTAAREAGAREERERWYVNLYDLADRIKKGL